MVCSTSPACCSALTSPRRPPSAHLAPGRHDLRRAARGRPAARADPPRPASARAQVQPRGAVRPGRRACGAAAARGRAGLQLPARADGAPRRGHAVPRVRPPDAPRAGRPATVGAVLRRRHRVGLRRGTRPDARGVGLGRRRAAERSPPTPTANRSQPNWSPGCGRPRSSARGSWPAPRCSTRHCRCGSTWSVRTTRPRGCWSCTASTA